MKNGGIGDEPIVVDGQASCLTLCDLERPYSTLPQCEH